MAENENNESILDVLLYLFEHYLDDDADLVQDRNSLLVAGPLLDELGNAGFSQNEVNRAFDWLESLAQQRPGILPHAGTMAPVRIYNGPELEKLDVASRGFLMLLEQNGVLSPEQREVVLDRAMALDQPILATDDLKWVVLMVLFNQPGAEAAYAWMETQIFDDEPESVH
jgi:Smg protein